jgi:hypothetical protein
MSMTEAEVRAYLRSTIPDTSPKIGRIERFANEYSRGVKKGISFGVAPGSLDNTLDVDPGNMDYTDIAVFAGEMIGSLPAALLTGFGATAVAKTLGVKAARTAVAAELAGDLAQATRMRKVAQVGQYLSARAADEAPMFARAIRSGVQAGYQSLRARIGRHDRILARCGGRVRHWLRRERAARRVATLPDRAT